MTDTRVTRLVFARDLVPGATVRLADLPGWGERVILAVAASYGALSFIGINERGDQVAWHFAPGRPVELAVQP